MEILHASDIKQRILDCWDGKEVRQLDTFAMEMIGQVMTTDYGGVSRSYEQVQQIWRAWLQLRSEMVSKGP